MGEILSKDAQGITVKLREGGSKIVFLSNTTPVSKSVSGSTQDLVVGTSVVVFGTTNPDGSMTATAVQIRPPSPTGRAGSVTP